MSPVDPTTGGVIAPAQNTPSPNAPSPPAAPSTPYQYISFRSDDPPMTVTALMDEDPPKITEGYGGWDSIERPANIAFTRWKGGLPYKMTVAIVLDGFATNRRVGPDYLRLERMGRDPGANDIPPIVNVFGPTPRTPNVDWVIEDIEWGDAMRNEQGYLVRQAAVVTLLQFVSPDFIRLSAARRHRKKKKKKRHHKKRRHH